MREYIHKLAERQDLEENEAYSVCMSMLKGSYDPVEAAAVLVGLRVKGEGISELRGFLNAVLDNALRISVSRRVIDIVGTGGDGLNTVNVSTLASIVVSSLDLPVAKHGNKGFSSIMGAADLMQALGYPIDMPPEKSAELIDAVGYAFLFAPIYHRALRNVAEIRRKLGVRTIFNLVGPIANPADPQIQVIGTPNREIQDKFSQLLSERPGDRRVAIVNGYPGMDEVSPSGPTRVIFVSGEGVDEAIIEPRDFGFDSIPLHRITGSSREELLSKAIDGLRGVDPYVSVFIAMNAGVALYLAEYSRSIVDGYHTALNQIKSGKAWKKLNDIVSYSREMMRHG